MSEPTREQIAVTRSWLYELATTVGEEARILAVDAVLALSQQPTPSGGVAPSCGFDTELYAAAYNDGWDASVAQEMQDHPLAFAVALRAAADRVEQDVPPATYQRGHDDRPMAGEHYVRNRETLPPRD